VRTTHLFPLAYFTCWPRRRSHRRGARHPPWTGHPGRPPAKLTPPPRPPTSARALPPFRPLRTGPPVRNRRRVHRRPVLTAADRPPPPPDVAPLLSLARGPAPTASAAPSPLLVGRLGPFCRGAARPRLAGPKSPPAQLAEKTLFFFFFPFSFPIFYIYVYILIFHAPKIV
jgi:hypothetical protein